MESGKSAGAQGGFAFSLDAAAAVAILAAGLALLAGIANEQSFSTSQSATIAGDTLYALEGSGYIVRTLDTNSATQSAQLIREQLLAHLPKGFDANVTVSAFTASAEACADQKSFAACFPDANKTSGAAGAAAPQGTAFVSGSKVYVRKQPPGDCNVSYASFSGDEKSLRYQPRPSQAKAYAMLSEGLFSDSDANVTFDVNVTPSGYLACDQNVDVTLTVSVPEDVRKPIDLMLVTDRSGSMSWDGQLNLTTANDVFLDGSHAYVADGSAGLRIVDVSGKATPMLVGTYNSPGTAYGASVSGTYAYLSDGSAGLQIVDISNPSNPQLTGTYNSPGTAYGAAASGNYAYLADNDQGLRVVDVSNKSAPSSAGVIANIGNVREVSVSGNYAYAITTSNPGTGILDLEASGTQSVDIAIGQSSTNYSAAQAFMPASNTIREIGVYVRDVGGNPSQPLTVTLRDALPGSGNDLASGTISANAIGSSYGWETVAFSGNVEVDPSGTYYIVLSKSGSTSTSRYYRWGATALSVYGNGNAYSMSSGGFVTSLEPSDALFRTHHRARLGLQVIDISDPAAPVHVSSVSGTDPRNAYISGSYAYLADGSAGMHIIDITTKAAPSVLGTYNTTGTAYDVAAYGDGNAYVADGTSLQVVRITDPAAPSLAKSYPTPYSYKSLGINGDWAFISPGYGNGLTTFNIYTGPKINQARSSASRFVDFNGWQLPPDQMGLVSFNTSATLDRSLTTDKNSIKAAISALAASGGTDMSAGITSATAELNSARHNPQALKFEVLLSDGQSSTDPSAAAQSAADSGIVIYTIGFGGDADAGQLANVAGITGGQYYSASDANALENVFRLIALEVSEMANDANIFVPLIPGAAIADDGNGSIMDGNLVFNAGTVTKSSPYITTYRANFPCTNSSVCKASAFTFPGPGTKFVYRDLNSILHTVDFNASATLSFRTRDLNVAITSGSVIGPGNISLDARVENSGDLDASPTTLRLRLNDTNGQILSSHAVPALCSPKTPGCESYTSLFPSVSLGAEGVIYASVNDDGSMSECPIGNYFAVNCYGGPAVQVYSVQYYAWRN